jgi:hypothetical protein
MIEGASGPAKEGPAGGERIDCFCMGLGPQITALLRGLVPAEGISESVRAMQLDVLRFLKELIDQRIESLSGSAPGSQGRKITIE